MFDPKFLSAEGLLRLVVAQIKFFFRQGVPNLAESNCKAIRVFGHGSGDETNLFVF